MPEQLDTHSALQLMQQAPLLIRRPLLEAEGRREIGFDQQLIHGWLGLTPNGSDLESCPKSPAHAPCPAPEK